MKRNFISLTFLVLFLFPAIHLIGQDSYPKATFSADSGITLDINSQLSDTYEIDIAKLGYSEADATNAVNFIQSKSDRITAKVDYAGKRIIIGLKQDNEAQAWTLENWNEHLKNVL